MNCFRRITLIVVGVVALLLGAVGIPKPAPQAAHAETRDAVIARAGTVLAPEGSLAYCVFQYVGQGIALAEAAKLCEVNLSTAPAGVDSPATGEGGIALDGVRDTSAGSVTVSCPSASSGDPSISSGAKDALSAAQKALQDFDRGHPQPYGVELAQRDELARKVNEAQANFNKETTDLEAREKAAAETKKMLEGTGDAGTPATPTTAPPPTTLAPIPPTTAAPSTSTPGSTAPGGTSPPTTAANTSKPVDGADQACQDFAAYVGECNLAGWATAPCQGLRRQLRGCIDSTIAYTTGDDPDEGCPADEPDEETVAEIVLLMCTSRAKVAPGYDPCGPKDLGGGPGIFEDPNADPCTGKNPYALTTGEGCEVTVQESPDFGMGPKIDPTMVVILGGPGIPTTTQPFDPKG